MKPPSLFDNKKLKDSSNSTSKRATELDKSEGKNIKIDPKDLEDSDCIIDRVENNSKPAKLSNEKEEIDEDNIMQKFNSDIEPL